MSAAEGQNGSAPGAGSVDLAALRARVRCGRSQPVVRHLSESDEALVQRHYEQEVIVLCSAEVTEPDPDVEDPDVEEVECLGCRDCFRYCPDCLREANRWSGGSFLSVSGEDPGHPAWCSPQHCYRTEEGERVHQSAPTRWEDCEVRFEITLVGPEADHRTYVELQLTSLMFPRGRVYAAMPVPAARRLRDELSAHLDAAAVRHQVARNWVGGVAGRVLTSSDLDAGAAPEHSGTTEADAEVPDPVPAAPGGGPEPTP